ncbi:MAG: hypothetical protein NTZ87_03545 [Candidatus Nomurabacteria bacterium]|nr:hypothetical protein [Candidatus Nomurabacteria bacterium]
MGNKNNAVVVVGNVYERLWKLYIMVGKMIMDGVRDPEKVAGILQDIVNQVAEKVYLRRLFETEVIIVGATDGKKTLEESGVFPGGVFGESLLGKCKPAPAIKVVVDELVENGKFPDFLGNTALQLEQRRLHRGHLANLSNTHSKKLCKDRYSVFAVVTKDDEPVKDDLSNVFVALVSFGDFGQLWVYVDEFSDDFVWRAQYQPRVVTPQQ